MFRLAQLPRVRALRLVGPGWRIPGLARVMRAVARFVLPDWVE